MLIGLQGSDIQIENCYFKSYINGHFSLSDKKSSDSMFVSSPFMPKASISVNVINSLPSRMLLEMYYWQEQKWI